MAATIRDSRNDGRERKPELIDRIDGFDCDIHAASILPNEDGFISISDDRFVIIYKWFKVKKILSFIKMIV